MKGVQQWHALDLADHRVKGWANGVVGVVAAVSAMEADRDSGLALGPDAIAEERWAPEWAAD